MSIGHAKSLAYEAWPQYDESFCVESMATIAVQVNGKVRSKIEVEISIPESGKKHNFFCICIYTHADRIQWLLAILEIALGQANVKKFTDGCEVKKTIYVPGKILNILV